MAIFQEAGVLKTDSSSGAEQSAIANVDGNPDDERDCGSDPYHSHYRRFGVEQPHGSVDATQ